ncbi:RHOMBOID-like protein 12, mitochondrial [Ipomoea triloba]|uniref:RHOMBOID-like protein 12, mitochondrial n=1 Tax=Ipomoea triloba TaxID=35885 RepID=UPI00125E9D94|nr:RHOMBOID-like protein 12, mitochondrial [Ipomoea triloba]
MQRLFSLKGLSKITRNLPNPSETFTLPPHHHLFSHFNTSCSRPHSWTAPNLKSYHGLFSSSLPKNPVLRNALLKSGQSNAVAETQNWLLRFRLPRRNFRSDFSSFSNRYTRGSWFQGLTPDGVVIGLILSNVAVFLLWRVADTGFMLRNFTISVDNFTSGRLHTLVTSAFSQADQWHLISNMVGLYFFGSSIGRTFGSEYVLKLYLSGAVLGSVFFLVYHAFIAPSMQAQRSRIPTLDSSRVPGMGASGAVNAIMLLDIFLFPKKTLYFDFIIPVPAILLGIFLIGKDVLRILEGDHRVSGSAHLGGAFAAAIAWARMRRGRFRF